MCKSLVKSLLICATLIYYKNSFLKKKRIKKFGKKQRKYQCGTAKNRGGNRRDQFFGLHKFQNGKFPDDRFPAIEICQSSNVCGGGQFAIA